MGKPTGFKEFKREVERTISSERLLDFKELYTDHNESHLSTVARCMDCVYHFVSLITAVRFTT